MVWYAGASFRPPEEPELKSSTGSLDSNNPIDRKKGKSPDALSVTGLPSSWKAIHRARGFHLNRMEISRKVRFDGPRGCSQLSRRGWPREPPIHHPRSSFFDGELGFAVLVKLICLYSTKTYLTLGRVSGICRCTPARTAGQTASSRMRKPQKVHGKPHRPTSFRRIALACHPSYERTSMRRSFNLPTKRGLRKAADHILLGSSTLFRRKRLCEIPTRHPRGLKRVFCAST